MTGVFAVGYGLSRFFVEYFRVPDPQFFSDLNPYGYAITFSNLGLTMGQLLSIPMIAAGMFLIFLVPLITVKKVSMKILKFFCILFLLCVFCGSLFFYLDHH